MLKHCYKILRNLVVGIVILVTALYLCIYVGVSLPPVQDWLGKTSAKMLQNFIGGKVEVGRVEISPFNRVTVHDVKLVSPEGDPVADIHRVSAGISLPDLILHRKIVVTYAEIVGLDGALSQRVKDGPLNIQYIITAVKPKDKTKPPTKFDLAIHNVVLRQCRLTYDKQYKPRLKNREIFDPNHIELLNLRADIDLSRIANDDFTADVKRMSFNLGCGFDVRTLKVKAHVTKTELDVRDLSIELPGSSIKLPDRKLKYQGYNDILPTLERNPLEIRLKLNRITPADFKCFVPQLREFKAPLSIDIDARLSRSNVSIKHLRFDYPAYGVHLAIDKTKVTGLNDFHKLRVEVGNIEANLPASAINKALSYVKNRDAIARHLAPLGDIHIKASGTGTASQIQGQLSLRTDVGAIDANGKYTDNKDYKHIDGVVDIKNLQAGRIAGLEDLGLCNLNVRADVNLYPKDFSGHVLLNAPLVTYRGYAYNNINLEAKRNSGDAKVLLRVADANLDLYLDAVTPNFSLPLSLNTLPDLALRLDLNRFHPAALNIPALASIPDASFNLNLEYSGSSLANINAMANVEDLRIARPDHDEVHIPYITATVHQSDEEGYDEIELDTPYLRLEAQGDMYLPKLPSLFRDIVGNIVNEHSDWEASEEVATLNRFDYLIDVSDEKSLLSLLNLPVRPLADITINGEVDSSRGFMSLNIDAPWLAQGEKKLIQNTLLRASVNCAEGVGQLKVASTLPAKKSDVRIELNALAHEGNIDSMIGWEFFKPTAYRGNVGVNTAINRDPLSGSMSASAEVLQSTFLVNDTIWNVNPASIDIANRELSVNGLKIWREGQAVQIDGNLSTNPDEQLHLLLNAIDLSYIFDVLDINYVNFGGTATGEFFVSGLAQGLNSLVAYTPGLHVRDLTYNDGRLGNAVIQSHWEGEPKMVKIDADIEDGPDSHTSIDGGIWVTRDSLSFDFDTHNTNIKFLQPFMKAFTSEVSGRATGHAKLYGTFSDIDLVGKVYANPIRLKVDYTNVYYTCTDTVEIRPGCIDINNVTIRDPEGHTAKLNGYVKHRYFHEPEFKFAVSDAQDMLCYNTNSSINPIWYGTIYGNGGGTITGYPGVVKMTIDMSTAPRSKFVLVLDKSEDADDYQFLKFTDRRLEAAMAAIEAQKVDTIPDNVKRFMRRAEQQSEDGKSLFAMDLSATITPDAQLTLVMDPIGGDRIRANGNGNLQIGYNSDTEEFTMQGRYTLQKGIYNFTLQDLILKDFVIRPGSTISFNGDPYDANLDITAAYRVNANLTDLDKSFATDRDLTRTNVPVEALLNVRGSMLSPDISFDIDMPTVTQDVVRKVKSLISTDDQLSLQVAYLLALNRFYTPEYTGTQRNNNELASVASSTVSAQLGNAFGRLSDNWSFTPYFRTEKGDFSDLEVDMAISSSLLNNRLLINGNLGYRDRATSTTTFVGDFDIEYLLNRQGSIRLKAYNHFNDANYYLRSALTTQGVGIIYKIEFDDFLNIFRHKRTSPLPLPTDTIPSK